MAARLRLTCQTAIALTNPALTVPGGRDITLADRPDNDTMLRLYALYKQGSEGDVSGPKPGFFDFVGTAKYEAWEKLAGTKPEDAMKKYVDLVKKLRG
jgi:acyl-CoA-binding protein